MNDFFALEYEGSRCEFLKYALEFDDLAFVRRAREAHAAWEQVLRQCRARRWTLLEMSRLRLAQLHALVDGGWSRLQPWLFDPQQTKYLRELFQQWAPRLRAPVWPASSKRELRRAAADLARSFELFNRRWEQRLAQFDLGPVNRVRDGYNRYYVLEKASAFGSESIAQAGFQPLRPLTLDDLWREFPPLQELRVV